MQQRIRVLLAIPHLGGGGAERVMALLAQHLDSARFEVHLVLITEDAAGARTLPDSVTVHRLHATRIRHAWYPLMRLIRTVMPDILLSGMSQLSFLLLLLKPLLPRRTCMLVRQNTTASAAGRSAITRLAYRWLYPRADGILCQSQAMADDLAIHFGLDRRRLAVVANPILPAVSSLSVAASNSPNLLFVGRLAPEKGVDRLLHAFAQLRKEWPLITLSLLGIGPEEASMRQLAEQLDITHSVHFAGYADPAPYFAAATLFVLPSTYEGMPNALLEAASAGLPLVATPASTGLVDLVRDAPGCWLARDFTVDAVADALHVALTSLISAPQRLDHAFLKPFQPETAVAAYARLMQDAVFPRRIVQLIPTIDQIGGAERQVLLLSKELARRGWQVTLITLAGNGQATAEELADSKISYLSLEMRKAWIDPRGWLRYLRWHRRNRPSIVHTHLPHATWFARYVRLLAPVPVLVDTVHTSKTERTGLRLGYRLSRLLANQVTAVSHAVADAIQSAGMAASIRVISNGVSMPKYQRDKAPAIHFRWIAVGRLAPVKNYPMLLRAFVLLPGAPTLTIVGAGPGLSNLRALAATLDLTDRVHFAGCHADVQPLLAEADAFVLASLWEGLPVSVLEASAAGLPVVATDAAGTREAMLPGTTGLLVPVDSVTELAAGMAQIMALSHDQRLQMGVRGRKFVEETFALDRVVDQWEQLYQTLQQQHRCPARWVSHSALAAPYPPQAKPQ